VRSFFSVALVGLERRRQTAPPLSLVHLRIDEAHAFQGLIELALTSKNYRARSGVEAPPRHPERVSRLTVTAVAFALLRLVLRVLPATGCRCLATRQREVSVRLHAHVDGFVRTGKMSYLC
jgi:hypothetical protein